MTALSAYKRARQETGSTLAQVGERSGIQISNLSAIEAGKRVPRIDTLERALWAVGKKFVPVANLRASAAELSEDIEIEIAADRKYDLFRFIAQLADNLAAATTVEEFYALVIEPAATTGSQDWDAAIAGVVEFRANQRGWPTPDWTRHSLQDPKAPQSTPAWVGGPPNSAELIDAYKTADEFTRRGVFVALEDLESI